VSAEPRTVTAQGLRFGYFEKGQGPLVLCLHGFPDTAHSFLETLEVLAGHGFRAVAPFARGYPPSDAAPDRDYSILRLGRDALALIEALGEKQAYLVGHDWGALAAYAAAALAPDRILGIATAAVPHLRAQVARGLVPAQARRSWYIGFFQLPRIPEWRVPRHDFAFIDRLWRAWSPGWRHTPRDIEPVKAALSQRGALAAALGYYRALPKAMALDRSSRASLLARVRPPAVTFAGVDDGCMGIEMFDRQALGFSGPFRLVPIEGAGHFMHREQPAIFHRELVEFLEELERARRGSIRSRGFAGA